MIFREYLKIVLQGAKTYVDNGLIGKANKEHTHSEYLTQHQDLSSYAKKTEVPTKTSQLTNDSSYIDSVKTINGQSIVGSGDVTIEGVSSWNDLEDKPTIPTKTSQLTNNSGYLTSIPSEYVTEDELNAKGYATQSAVNQLSEEIGNQQEQINDLKQQAPNVPVTSVNGKTGDVVLNANDVGATTKDYVDSEVADLNAKLQQYHLNVAQGETVSEALAWLETNGDKTEAYVLPDGFIYTYQETVVDSGPSYTNVLPLAIDTDKTIYNGVGYMNGKRLSSSAVVKDASGCGHTGYIEVKLNDVVRMKNHNSCTSGYHYYHAYKEDFSHYVAKQDDNLLSTVGGTYTYTIVDGSTKYIRFSVGEFSENTIITINEEITEGGGTSIVEAWASTGHAFIPADYDDDIASLKRITNTHANEIAELKESGVSTNATTMFISPTGNDSNDGLTKNTPKKTVKACVNAGATRISAKRGVYNEVIQLWNIDELEIFPTDNDLTYTVGTEREPIVFEMADYITLSSLATYNSIKRVAYSNSSNTQFDKVFTKKSLTPIVGDGYGSRYNSTIWLLSNDEKTVCIKLKPVLTIAECEAEINTFTYVDGYIYINADMTNVDNIVVPSNWDSGFYINGANRLVLKEVEVRFSGTYNLDLRNCAFFDLYKCACKYTSYGSGFHPYNSNGVMKSCYATKNYDGYGISGYGHTTYIDCISEFNFDDGMSHHDGTSGTVIGGRYEGNGKGGNTPAYGSKVNIYGGLYKNNASFGIGYLWASGLEPASGMVQGAVMVGNTVGIKVDANCTVTMMSCLLKDNDTERTINANAILTEYGTVKS